jgi:hypothetical protein
MALKSEHFTTPIKLVLPGIIVSLIGLTVSNVIFNDPVKIRGRHSRTAWDNLVRYQKIYEQNAEGLTCQYSPNIGEYYFKDLIHLQEMTIENLKMLKEDKDIDKIVGSIINLRIDTYTQLKNLTVNYIDTIMVLDQYDRAITDPAIRRQLEEIVHNVQTGYINDRQHISTRDTSIISNLGSELKKAYASFESASFRSASLADIIDTIHRKIIGKWSMVKNGLQVEVRFNNNNQGSLMQNNKEEKFSWKFLGKDSTRLDIDFQNVFLLDWKLNIPYVSELLMQYKDVIENGVVLTACRIKEE